MTLEHAKKLDSHCPSFSIIIEWENQRFAELQVAKRMLQQVAKQIREISVNLALPSEIIILYNKDATKGYKIEQFVRKAMEPFPSLLDLKIISTPNLRYYEQRNFGAEHCSREIIILIDCDTVPDDEWLPNLLQPFSDHNVSVVGGLNYMSPVSSFDKGYTLFWIMPPKNDTDGKTAQLQTYVPDNVAFRREVFLANKFPQSNSFRGVIVDHNNMLKNKGYKIVRQPKAKVAHAPINGLRHLVLRSLVEGNDKYLAWRGLHDQYINKSSRQKHSIVKFYKEKISLYHERKKFMNLNTKDMPVIFFVGSIYFGFMVIGAFLTLISPGLLRKNIKI